MLHPFNCYILIGLPGSGKSTLATQIITQNPQYKIVSSDQIRQNLYGKPSIQGQWPQIEPQILHQIETAQKSHTPVIYDATNTNRNHRINLLQKLSNLGQVSWIGLYLITPLETCKHRNRNRQYPVPEIVIDTMAQNLAQYPPTKSEGFANLFYLTESDVTFHSFQ